MITLHRLGGDGHAFALNCDLILTVEATPDTVIQLVTGGRMVVRESVGEVIEKVAAWRGTIAHRGLHASQLTTALPGLPDDDSGMPPQLRPI